MQHSTCFITFADQVQYQSTRLSIDQGEGILPLYEMSESVLNISFRQKWKPGASNQDCLNICDRIGIGANHEFAALHSHDRCFVITVTSKCITIANIISTDNIE